MSVLANAPSGVTPIGTLSGGNWNQHLNLYCIPAADNTNNYFIGDVVKSAAGSDNDGIPYVAKITDTNVPLGCIVGISPLPVPNNPSSLVGSALALEQIPIPKIKARAYYVWVCDAPDLVFECMDDGTTTANIVATYANTLSSFTVTAEQTFTNAAVNPLSNTVLKTASFTATASAVLPVRLMGLVNKPGNNFTTVGGVNQYLRWRCTWGTHQYAHTGTFNGT